MTSKSPVQNTPQNTGHHTSSDLSSEKEALPAANKPTLRTRLKSDYSTARSAIAPLTAAGQMNNKFITATYKIDSFAKMHHVSPIVEISLIAARMTCVFFVTAKSTKDKMQIPSLNCRNPNLQNVDYELSWLKTQFYFAKQNKLSALETFYSLLANYAFRGRRSENGQTYFLKKMKEFANLNGVNLKGDNGQIDKFGTVLLAKLVEGINPNRNESSEETDYNNPEESIASIFRLSYHRFNDYQDDLDLDFGFALENEDQLEIKLAASSLSHEVNFVNYGKKALQELLAKKQSQLEPHIKALKPLEEIKIKDKRGRELSASEKNYSKTAETAETLYKKARQCVYEIALCQAFIELDNDNDKKKIIPLFSKHFNDENAYHSKLIAINLTTKQIKTSLAQRRNIISQHLSCHAGKYETSFRNKANYISNINTFVFASFAGLAGLKVAKLIAPFIDKALNFFKFRHIRKANTISNTQDVLPALSAGVAAFVSQNFGKDGIRNTYAGFGRFIDGYRSNATNKKTLRTLIGLNSIIAIASVATTPLLYVGTAAGIKFLIGGLVTLLAVSNPAILVTLACLAASTAGYTLYKQRKSSAQLSATTVLLTELALAILLPSPITWAILSISLVAIAAVGSVGIFCSQAAKIKKAVKEIKLEYKRARADGPLAICFFGLKITLALSIAAATIAISVAGDVFGFKSVAHSFGFDKVFINVFAGVTAACSALCNSVQNLADTTKGVLRELGSKGKSISKWFKTFKQSKYPQKIKQGCYWLFGLEYAEPIITESEPALSSHDIYSRLTKVPGSTGMLLGDPNQQSTQKVDIKTIPKGSSSSLSSSGKLIAAFFSKVDFQTDQPQPEPSSSLTSTPS